MANGEGGATTRFGRFTQSIGSDAEYHTDTVFAPVERTIDWGKHRIAAPFVKWAAIGAIGFGVVDGGVRFLNNGGIQSDDKSGVVAMSMERAMADYWNVALEPFVTFAGGLIVGTTKAVAKGAVAGVKAGIETAKETAEPPTDQEMQNSSTYSSPQYGARTSQTGSKVRKGGNNAPVNVAMIEKRAMERMAFPASAVNRTARAPVKPVQATARSNPNR